jgi:transcriptional regulator with XRE-family HTH domain
MTSGVVSSGMALLDDLRNAISKSGRTGYDLSRASGVTAGQLSRFMRGERGLSVETVESLADALGLEITLAPKRRRGRKANR